MSTGRIMTLSVESLNKLYFNFLEAHILPLLPHPDPHVTKLLQKRTAYEAHRFLEDLLAPQAQDSNHASLNESADRLSNRPLANTNTNTNNYTLSSPAEPPKRFNEHRSFEKSLDKQSEEKKNTGKLGLRRTLTGTEFDHRIKQFKIPQKDEKNEQVGLTHSVGQDSLIPIPSLGTPSLSSDFKSDYKSDFKSDFQKPSVTPFDSIRSPQKRPKLQAMKESIQKISKVFNDNHSKIQKYSKKVQSQPYSLNGSTKIQRRQQSGMGDYQFHAKDINNRRY